MFALDQDKTLEAYRRNGWKILGYFCSYTPEELFYARKILPVRIFPKSTGNFNLADKYFPGYTCSFGRSALNALLSGDFDFCDGFFFSSTCDTIRCLIHHCRRRYPDKLFPHLTIPSKAYSQEGYQFLHGELLQLERYLDEAFGAVDAAALGDVMRLYRENRALVRDVVAIRMREPGLVPAATMNQIYRYNMWMDKETANRTLRRFLSRLTEAGCRGSEKPKLFVLGNCCGNNEILEFMEGCGCRVVNDLLASGNKYFCDVEEQQTALHSIAYRMHQKTHCPIKVYGEAQHRERMLSCTEEAILGSGADGIVVLGQKFCDPHGLEKPFLLPRLKSLGLPVLELESEQDLSNKSQLETRLEAFLEMIERRESESVGPIEQHTATGAV